MTKIHQKTLYKIAFFTSVAALGCLIIVSGTLGSADISFLDSLRIMLSKIPRVGQLIDISDIKASSVLIVTKIRLPRIILSVLVGMCLAVVGTTLQSMFRNPMADTGVLGISSGAGLGAAIAIVTGLTKYLWGLGLTALFAFIGAMVTVYLVYGIARINGRVPVVTLVLSGIAVSFICSSLTQLMMVFNRTKVEMIVMWTMGSFSAANWEKVMIIGPVILISSLLITLFSRELNIISTGEEAAHSLGVDVEKTKKILLFISSIATAACVSVSGVIGFVGLIIPHIIRLLTGADQRVLLPFSLIGGAIFMLVCDTLARTLTTAEIPVGIITSLFGAPFFIYLILMRKKRGVGNG